MFDHSLVQQCNSSKAQSTKEWNLPISNKPLLDNSNGFVLGRFEARGSENSSNTRIGARGFAWANLSGRSDVQTFQIGVMNSSRVVATRSRRSPGINFSAVLQSDRHCVASFNTYDISPWDRMSSKWINNLDSFVEDDDLGSKHNAVENGQDQRGVSERQASHSEVAVGGSLYTQSTEDENQKKVAVSAASSPETLDVISRPRFLHAPMLTYRGSDCLV